MLPNSSLSPLHYDNDENDTLTSNINHNHKTNKNKNNYERILQPKQQQQQQRSSKLPPLPLTSLKSKTTKTMEKKQRQRQTTNLQVIVGRTKRMLNKRSQQQQLYPKRFFSISNSNSYDSTDSLTVNDENGTLIQRWDPRLPRPPSMKKIYVSDSDSDDDHVVVDDHHDDVIQVHKKELEEEKKDDHTTTTTLRSPRSSDTIPRSRSSNSPKNRISVCVFNANSKEGSTMVRILSKRKNYHVIAVVRNFKSPIAMQLMNLKNVTVKVASWMDQESLIKAAEGCQQAYFITSYWEKFESQLEEQIATNVLIASSRAGIRHLVFATYENHTMEYRVCGNLSMSPVTTTTTTNNPIHHRNVIGPTSPRLPHRSQLVPDCNGKIHPKFGGKKRIHKMAKELKVHVTDMMTAFYDDNCNNNDKSDKSNCITKKSLVLIRKPNGKIVTNEFRSQ